MFAFMFVTREMKMVCTVASGVERGTGGKDKTERHEARTIVPWQERGGV